MATLGSSHNSNREPVAGLPHRESHKVMWGSPVLDDLPQKFVTSLPLTPRLLPYVSNASPVAPIHSEWVNISMHLFTRVTGDRVPEDLRKESLSNYQMGLLSDLKRWICRQRIKAR